MFTLSVAMIVKNEQQTLARALQCAATFADEIVVVDTGSTDNTKQIARAFTPNVFDFEWCDDFAAARNFSFSKATCDYVMWLDADDVVQSEDIQKIVALKNGQPQNIFQETNLAKENLNLTKENLDLAKENPNMTKQNPNLAKENLDFTKESSTENNNGIKEKKENNNGIKEKKSTENDVDVYMCRYCTGFDEQNQPALTYFRERILKNGRFKWQGFVHEVIVPSGKISYTNITIQHRKLAPSSPKRNLQIYQRHKKSGHVFSAREQYYYSRELFYNGHYKSAIKGFKNFLARPATEKYPPDEIGAHIMIADCHSALAQPQKAVEVLSKLHQSFAPTAESACKLAYAHEQIANMCQNFLQSPPNAKDVGTETSLKQKHLQSAKFSSQAHLQEIAFSTQEHLQSAIFWFRAALCCQPRQSGFVCQDYALFLPCLELSRLLYHTDYAAAKQFHQKAAAARPTHPSVLFNQKFFQKN